MHTVAHSNPHLSGTLVFSFSFHSRTQTHGNMHRQTHTHIYTQSAEHAHISAYIDANSRSEFSGWGKSTSDKEGSCENGSPLDLCALCHFETHRNIDDELDDHRKRVQNGSVSLYRRIIAAPFVPIPKHIKPNSLLR